MHADLVLINANILTMNASQPHARAVAVQGDRIVKAGSSKDIKAYIGKKTKVLDLREKTVIPGLIDTHAHVTAYGKSLTQINLRGVNSIKEIQTRLLKRIQRTPRGQWILGRGWDQDRLKEGRYPTRWDLDEVSPHNPVVLTRVCGHLSVANSQALEKAAITGSTQPPPSGQIDRDVRTKEPTGILREDAMILVTKIISPPNEEELTEACSLACQRAVSAGLTSIHWLVNSPTEIRVIQKLHEQKRLLLRAYLIIPVKLLDHLVELGLKTGFGNTAIRIGSIKIYTDGSLGARTAALSQPYHDKPSRQGLLLYTSEELNILLEKAHKAGLQLAIHAIGDRAIEMVLNQLEKLLKETPRQDHRHRIEHASVLNEQHIQRLKRLNAVVTVQPHFVVSDFWVPQRLGPHRARWVYPFKTLIKKGIMTCGGSDCPIEPIEPLLGIYAAVAREALPEERITIDEALRLYTSDAAFASFEENIKGSIEVGKLADFTVLSHDLREVAPREIKNVKVEMTIVGGQAVYIRT